MTHHTLYVLDRDGTPIDELDNRCHFRLDDAGMRRLCADMKRLAMLQADGSSQGIPESTLCSNDGYVVSPVGVTQALEALRAAPGDEIDEVRVHWQQDGTNHFDRWIQFLERAADAGGFQIW